MRIVKNNTGMKIIMNREKLEATRYHWEKDPRKLRVIRAGLKTVPDGRCYHCGRIFLNGTLYTAYCRECDEQMSISVISPDHDFDSCGRIIHGQTKEGISVHIDFIGRRDTRIPIEFDEEHFYFERKNSNFKTATGKPLAIAEPELTDEELAEQERIKRLYEMK
jgi:hypothetical protein